MSFLRPVALAALFSISATGCALAQAYYGSSDPCLPPPGGLFGAVVGGLSAQQRRDACVAERKQQWADYYARQRAEQQQRDAQEAAQQAAQEAEQARAQREEAEREAARIAAEKQRERAEIEQRRAAYAQLIAAETSPENHCRDQQIARALIEQWSDFDTFKEANIRAIDIEHLTTVAFDPVNATMTCHGIFVTNRGGRLAGILQIRKNVAGDPIVSWNADSLQDLSAYEAPPPLPEPAPEPARSFAPTTAAVVSPAPAAGGDKPNSFSVGLADRQIWEAWINGLSGDEKDGAAWWAAHRSVAGHGSCATAVVGDNAAWSAGCLNAQQRLTPIDLRRRSDPDYRKGWNSF